MERLLKKQVPKGFPSQFSCFFFGKKYSILGNLNSESNIETELLSNNTF